MIKGFNSLPTNRLVWGLITVMLFAPFWLPGSFLTDMASDVFDHSQAESYVQDIRFFALFVIVLFLCIFGLSWYIQGAVVLSFRRLIQPRLELRYGTGTKPTPALVLRMFREIRGWIGLSRARRLTCVILIVSSIPYHFCQGHLCMGGHMMHPPYSLVAYLGDAVWISGFILAVFFSIFSNLWWRYILWMPIGYLFFTRFRLYRYMDAPVELYHAELPLQIALCLLAIIGLISLRKRRKPVFCQRIQ